MIVEVTQQAPDWSVWLSQRTDATILHEPRWGELMRKAYGNRPWFLTARREGRIVGVLQLVEQRSLLFGSHLCSIPYFDAAHPNIPARLDVSPVRPPGNDSPTVVSDAAGRPRAAYVA